mmetsp:Transcript_43866/g.80144  ORF Transcript_43866/g.80144 Transcript_43866/m.80144 type:complete len:479 (-) Transcript_43866:35-1471(-)
MQAPVASTPIHHGIVLVGVHRKPESIKPGRPWNGAGAASIVGSFAATGAGLASTKCLSTRKRSVAARTTAVEDASPLARVKPQRIIYIAVFLHLLGFTMNGPIIPSLRKHFGLAAAKTGFISSAFPFGAIFAATIFPALSDRIGRKPVLLMSYAGVGMGFILQGLAVANGLPFAAFISLRVLSGAFAGASVVVKAYLADVASKATLPKYMARREAAGTLAFIIGPAISGILLSLTSVSFVVAFSGATSLLAAALVLLLLEKQQKPKLGSTGKPSSAAAAASSLPSEEADSRARRRAIIVSMMLVSFFYNIGQSFFDSFFGVLMVERFSVSPATLGQMFTVLACLVFVTAGWLYYPLVRFASTSAVAAGGLALMALGMRLLGAAGGMAAVVAGVLLYGVGLPLFTPSVPIILTEASPPGRRGLILGIDSAVNTVARVLSPTLMGMIYQGHGAAAAFQRASLVLVGGASLLLCLKAGLRA